MRRLIMTSTRRCVRVLLCFVWRLMRGQGRYAQCLHEPRPQLDDLDLRHRVQGDESFSCQARSARMKRSIESCDGVWRVGRGHETDWDL